MLILMNISRNHRKMQASKSLPQRTDCQVKLSYYFKLDEIIDESLRAIQAERRFGHKGISGARASQLLRASRALGLLGQ